jgi:hypothetical protein
MSVLSSEANIGKILILVGIVISVVSTLALFAMSIFAMYVPIFGVFTIIFGIVGILGVIYGILAYKACNKGDFHKAGIYAIISSVLPPLDIIMLAGAILCLVSKEGKK